MPKNVSSDIANSFGELATLATILSEDPDFQSQVQQAADLIYEKLSSGGTLFTAGNGGSAAEAQHFSGEFVGRFRRERKEFPAVALTAESSAVTAIGNDYSYDQIFARQIRALGKKGDVFVALTTSGNSANIVEAVKAAKANGVTTICLLGKGGGEVAGTADVDIIVPSDLTARIQEVHLLIIHSICEAFDSQVLG